MLIALLSAMYLISLRNQVILLQGGEKKKQEAISTSQILESETLFLLNTVFACALLHFSSFCYCEPLGSRTYETTNNFSIAWNFWCFNSI